jgi:aspartate aminotransferase
MDVSATVAGLPRSGIREIMDLAWSLGDDVIRLEAGEPNFPTPPHIAAAGAEAVAAGQTRYTPNAGVPELRAALAQRLRTRHDVEVTAERIVVTCGATQGLFATLLVLLEPGDEVLLPDPGWPNFAMMATLLHALPVRYPLTVDAGFLPRVEDLEGLVGPRTRVLVLNSPSNPLGAVIPRGRLLELLAFASRHDLWVVSDECYDEIVFDPGFASATALDTEGRTVGVYSFSKTYAMTGWRVGYLALPEPVAPLLAKVQEPLVSCVSAPGQRAALAALTGSQDVVKVMTRAYERRRDEALRACAAAGLPTFRPSGAFYLWVDISAAGMSSRDFTLALATQAHVTVAPGTTFGPLGDGYVRVSLATDPDILREGVRRMIDLWQAKAE